MSEIRLFGGAFRFKREVLKGVELLESNTRIYVKIDSGPRFDVYTIKLIVGNSPRGVLAADKLRGQGAFREIENDGQPKDILWLIGGATHYVFVMERRSHPGRPVVAVETSLDVFTDKRARIYLVHT